MFKKINRQDGFTIVELLIVIVVIAILAAITVASYNGIQKKARDAQRSGDIAMIARALEAYKIEKGSYPQSIQPSGGGGGWEIGNDLASGRTFIQDLGAYSGSKIPADPVNSGQYHYDYIYLNGHTFSNGCRINEQFYVIRVAYEVASNNPIAAGEPAATCDGANGWQSTQTLRYYAPAQALR